MRAVTWQGRRDVRVEDVPDPIIKEPTDAIIKVTSTGLCGSDLHWYRDGAIGGIPWTGPFVLGHEMGGVIASGPFPTLSKYAQNSTALRVVDDHKLYNDPEIYPPEDESYRPKAAAKTMFIDHVDLDTAATMRRYRRTPNLPIVSPHGHRPSSASLRDLVTAAMFETLSRNAGH